VRFLGEVRSALVRVSTYLGVANFLVLMGIVARWLHGVVSPGFPFLLWMACAFVVLVCLVAFGAWVDRRFIWRQELAIAAQQNPVAGLVVLLAEESLRGTPHESEAQRLIEEMSKRRKVVVKPAGGSRRQVPGGDV
jgi:hypothetical protein